MPDAPTIPYAPTIIEITATVTLDDQLRYLDWLIARPAARRRRWLIQGAAVVLTPLLSVLLGMMTVSLTSDQSFGMLLRGAPHDRGTLLILAEVMGLMVLFIGLSPWVRRPFIRRRMRKLLMERPGVDAKDPALGEPAWFTAGPEGFTCRTIAATATVGWAGVKRLGDAGTILVVETGRYTGYIVPKRCLEGGQAAALAHLFQAHGIASDPS